MLIMIIIIILILNHEQRQNNTKKRDVNFVCVCVEMVGGVFKVGGLMREASK